MLAGSRFLNRAEKNYAAIEGKSLSIVWSLEQTKYFTKCCKDLVVVTDHKPLVRWRIKQNSEHMHFRLKQRTLPWLFEVHYMPGKTNLAADSASCYLTLTNEVNSHDSDLTDELLLITSLSHSMAITWEEIVEDTLNNRVLSRVSRCIKVGRSWKHDESLSTYFRYDDTLYLKYGFILYKDRVVVPVSLRSRVLNELHSAHQGVTSMHNRAKQIVF